jgi:hypothetical protein
MIKYYWVITALVFYTVVFSSAFVIFAKTRPAQQVDKSITTTEMIKILKPQIDPSIATIIAKEIDKYEIFPKELIVSLMFKESSFNPLAVSSSDCIGLMQINPKAHPDKIDGLSYNELFHISNNIRIGHQILEEYYNETNSVKKALLRYFGANNKEYIENILSNFLELSSIKKKTSEDMTE